MTVEQKTPSKSNWQLRSADIDTNSEIVGGFAGNKGFYLDPREVFPQLAKGALFYQPAENGPGQHTLRRKISAKVPQTP
ncbi:hypothetical protein HY384_00990 [Candidatus Daviesbacteria bacterium]|nr:hypothetical protein [Candidatus Daviesbacteria bacterium]